jgi:hypothetical protein
MPGGPDSWSEICEAPDREIAKPPCELLLTGALRLSCLSKKGHIVGLVASQRSVVSRFCPFSRVLCYTAYNAAPDSGVCSPRIHRRRIPPSPPEL